VILFSVFYYAYSFSQKEMHNWTRARVRCHTVELTHKTLLAMFKLWKQLQHLNSSGLLKVQCEARTTYRFPV